MAPAQKGTLSSPLPHFLFELVVMDDGPKLGVTSDVARSKSARRGPCTYASDLGPNAAALVSHGR